ncbi:MAG: glycosyltransferase family 2 protein [Eubacterium sp.]|nr:glycosyltransferase family 2 protein [Eubacterium sp.]
MHSLVSVVVPVYNVKKYLSKCVESIMSQTYDNYEVLLIDDGSTDGSSEMCDRFAEQYEKIFAYHKENGGLSDARNFANKYLKGDYIVYIDSDDYVDSEHISILTECMSKYNADFVIAAHIEEDEFGTVLNKKNFDNKVTVYDTKSALEEMCYEKKIGTSAWGKLIKRETAFANEFPKGMLYEDLATIYKMIGSCSKIVYIDQPIYHYLQRNGSIRFSKYTPKVIHIMQAAENLLDFINEKYPDIRSAGIHRYFLSANEFCARAVNEKDFLGITRKVRVNLRKYWSNIQRNPKVSIKQKTKYWLMTFQPLFYKSIRRIIKK